MRNMQGERNQNTSKPSCSSLTHLHETHTHACALLKTFFSLHTHTRNHLLWHVNNVPSSPPPPRARPPYSITFMKICIWELCRNMRLSWRGFRGEVIHFNKSIKWEVNEVHLWFSSLLSFLYISVRFQNKNLFSEMVWWELWIKRRRNRRTLTFSHIWISGSWNVISVKQRTPISLFWGNTGGALFDCFQPSNHLVQTRLPCTGKSIREVRQHGR